MLGVSLSTEAAGGRWLGKCSLILCDSQTPESLCGPLPFANSSAGLTCFCQTGAVASGRFSPFPESQESGTIGNVEACGQSIAGPGVAMEYGMLEVPPHAAFLTDCFGC